MKYIISEQQLDTVFGMYNPKDFLYYKNLAEPFRFKRQFMKKYPKEYYIVKKAGILDDLKDWDVVNNINVKLTLVNTGIHYRLLMLLINYLFT